MLSITCYQLLYVINSFLFDDRRYKNKILKIFNCDTTATQLRHNYDTCYQLYVIYTPSAKNNPAQSFDSRGFEGSIVLIGPLSVKKIWVDIWDNGATPQNHALFDHAHTRYVEKPYLGFWLSLRARIGLKMTATCMFILVLNTTLSSKTLTFRDIYKKPYLLWCDRLRV